MINKGLNSPPDALKAGIMNNVGLSKNFNKLLYVIPVLIAFGLGFLLSDFTNDSSENFATAYPSYDKESINLSYLDELNISPIKANISDVGILKSQNSEVYATQNKVASSSVKSEKLVTDNKKEEIAKTTPTISNSSLVQNNLNTSNNYNFSSDIAAYAQLPTNQLSQKTNVYSLELRGLQLDNFHDSEMPNFNTGINNFAVAVFYSLSENFKIGAEFGQENFIQKYNYNDGEFTTLFEQNYTSNFFGLTAKYSDSFLEELPNLSFYSKAFLGGVRTGPMGRVEAGLSYDFFGYSMFVGYDLAHISYLYQGNLFHSTKSGFTYGLSINL
jgi:hypothetical protein